MTAKVKVEIAHEIGDDAMMRINELHAASCGLNFDRRVCVGLAMRGWRCSDTVGLLLKTATRLG